IFNSLIPLGAMPPLIGFIVRPDSVERHTLQNILETHAFTVNHVKEEFYKQAHQTSARYAEHESEFEKVGLTEDYKADCVAPFVKESLVKFSIDFIERINLSINKTVMIIGKIKNIHLPADCVRQDGFADLEKAGSIAVSGLDSYYTTRPIARLSYAKQDQIPSEI
ncbi:MAG: flavin reductase, partial [Cytophagaceae bacterium]|nr:flavin reductase [Cytophagaceae bacterium]